MSGNDPATNPVLEEADLDWPDDEDLDTEDEFSGQKVFTLEEGVYELH